MRAFVEAHRSPAEPVLRVDAPLSGMISASKHSAVYSLHPYHLGKKPHDAVAAHVRHYTRPGDLVLDPFCGSGSTLVAAASLGRPAVGIDVSPAATFIARFYLTPCDPAALERRFEALTSAVAAETDRLYGTSCHRCGGPAVVHYVIYSTRYECPRCLGTVTLYEALAATGGRKPGVCPRCRQDGASEPISTRLPRRGFVPVAVNFSCRHRPTPCDPVRLTRSVAGGPAERDAFFGIDLRHLERIALEPVPHPYPKSFMMHVDDPRRPWGDEWRPSRDVRTVDELFTPLNLRAVAALMHAAGADEDLRAVITSGMLAVSRKAQHLDAGGGYIPGTWALPAMSKQRHVVESLRSVFRRTLKAKRELARLFDRGAPGGPRACLSTQSAADLSAIPSGAIDYIFTDPPYGGTVQYAELNFLWESWLGLDTRWHPDEVIVNQTRGLTADHWAARLGAVMAECYRVLKPGRWLSLCYHDASPGGWVSVRAIMAGAGFVLESPAGLGAIDTGGVSYNQRTADKTVKRDLVLSFRKPEAGIASPEGERPSDDPAAAAFIRGLITRFVADHPGSTRDRVYDAVVGELLRTGRMESHDFGRLLREAAQEVRGARASRWYPR